MTSGSKDELPEYLQISIGETIKAWRSERGLTLEELAIKAGIGITRGYLSQVENDKIRNPSAAKVAQIAKALEVEPLKLVTRQLPGHEGPQDQERASQPPSRNRWVAGEVPGLVSDVSKLLEALAQIHSGRQQAYVDGLTSLVEELSAAETPGKTTEP